MILYKPYMANATITDFAMKQVIQKLYIYRSAESKNRNRLDGLLSTFNSGLYFVCSLSVGILLYMSGAGMERSEMKGWSYGVIKAWSILAMPAVL